MGFDLGVFFSAGSKDIVGAVPAGLTGVLALALLFLRRAEQRVVAVFCGVFLAVLITGGVVADLKILDTLIMTPLFFALALAFFFFLGVVFLGLGILFFREWGLLRAGVQQSFAPFIPALVPGEIAAALAAFLIALTFGFAANCWPAHYQAVYQGYMASARGSFWHYLAGLLIYGLFRHAGVWLLAAAFMLAKRPENAALLRARISLVSIVLSAAFLAVGGALIHFSYLAVTQPWF